MSNGSAAKRNTLTTPEWIVMSALWGREPQVLGEIMKTVGDRWIGATPPTPPT